MQSRGVSRKSPNKAIHSFTDWFNFKATIFFTGHEAFLASLFGKTKVNRILLRLKVTDTKKITTSLRKNMSWGETRHVTVSHFNHVNVTWLKTKCSTFDLHLIPAHFAVVTCSLFSIAVTPMEEPKKPAWSSQPCTKSSLGGWVRCHDPGCCCADRPLHGLVALKSQSVRFIALRLEISQREP